MQICASRRSGPRGCGVQGSCSEDDDTEPRDPAPLDDGPQVVSLDRSWKWSSAKRSPSPSKVMDLDDTYGAGPLVVPSPCLKDFEYLEPIDLMSEDRVSSFEDRMCDREVEMDDMIIPPPSLEPVEASTVVKPVERLEFDAWTLSSLEQYASGS
ncbi:hypothetical protein SARC_06797 [Sphaeroforma arctica JP610]|uniref:Uncharacterized protein n=1 Tax=Sphaeroforma arctica JP610 TaxID=667725 RepID=A0A0L0FWA8_9EUKA|nr:hypothetical protein SARC_06797 [Sphaeroforma arctica JP610]KNC80856.1 hypothetical protein SARC_06797 [Sphaeroforma arctica JP610]|eukprot:XP_014154758.1 hypothetical protein SARC_06797 [Sphaeroforma arctica JP610]